MEVSQNELYLIINALTFLHTNVGKLGTASHVWKAEEIKELATRLDVRFVALYFTADTVK